MSNSLINHFSSLNREQMLQRWLWCSTEPTSHQRRSEFCPWRRLLLWATTSRCVAHVSPSAVAIPPPCRTLSRYSETVWFYAEMRCVSMSHLISCFQCQEMCFVFLFLDLVCFHLFVPGKGSGFRDCQYKHPVPTPEQLRHCWHHCCLHAELIHLISITLFGNCKISVLCSTICLFPLCLTPRWGYSRWVWPAVDCPLCPLSASSRAVQGQRCDSWSEWRRSEWVWH